MTLRFAAEGWGWRVVEAAASADLLAVAAAERPDVCVIDVNMPGASFSQRLTALLSIDPDMAVVVLSGESRAPDEARDLNLPFLSKPIELATLARALETALATRQPAVHAGSRAPSWTA